MSTLRDLFDRMTTHKVVIRIEPPTDRQRPGYTPCEDWKVTVSTIGDAWIACTASHADPEEAIDAAIQKWTRFTAKETHDNGATAEPTTPAGVTQPTTATGAPRAKADRRRRGMDHKRW